MPAFQKQILRQEMKEKRERLSQEIPNAGEQLAVLFFKHFDFPPEMCIGGYWPIGSELDIRPLLDQLHDKGFVCALPCLEEEIMTYRQWSPSTALHQKNFHTFEPNPTAPLVIPDVLLVPFLAFDHTGHRLGYGQGHFDQYLHHHKAITIGVGFKGQEVDRIPHQPHDFVLDMILTEEGLVKSKAS